jgi:hypothetical protein
MANIFAIGVSRRILHVTFDGTHHWDSLNPASGDGYFPGGMQLVYVQFLLQGNHTIRLRDGSPTAAPFLEAKDMINEGRALSLRNMPKIYPCINAADVINGDILILGFI